MAMECDWLWKPSEMAVPGTASSESAPPRGGLREPPRAAHVRPLAAECSGRIVHIDNRKLSRLAKLAGAPERKAAGVHLQLRLGDVVSQGQTLMELHAQTPGEMAYALQYAVDAGPIVHIEA